MSNTRVNKLALMCAASVVALTTAAHAQSTATESVTVTGSRIISDITLSPTPITAVSTEQLQQTTPTNIPDALNKLPVFIGGRTPRSQDNGSRNTSGNVLSLRNFGVSRTLVLLDGHRVPASNFDGSVDVDTLPQMLMSRVDVVTGGASAVYGSDAVAGVVNFILDKKFDGFKYNINAGISKYGDAAEQQLGIAWGTDLFGGRGHFEMAAKHFNQDMVPNDHRPYQYNNNTWVQAGSGSLAQPFVNVPFGYQFNAPLYGNVNCGTGCAYNNYTFKQPGIISPLTHGIPTTTANLEQGGDGGFNNVGTFRAKLRSDELFGRASYDLDDTTTLYVQANWAESGNFSNWSTFTVSSAGSRPNSFFANNPFLAPATQAQLMTGTRFLPGAAPSTAPLVASPQTGTTPPPPPANIPFFSDPSYIINNVAGQNSRSQNRIYNTKGVQRNVGVEAGLTGTWDRFAWDVSYNHGESRLQVTNPHNTDQAKYLAAQDAVIAPTGTKVNGVDVGGSVVCWVTTQAAFANLYPGCQPMNLFDPAGPSSSSYEYVSRPTWWTLTQVLDDINGSIHGGLWGLGLPAGEITAGLSGEMRWATYTMASQFLPTEFVNCTGLRMCLANGAAPVRWVQNVNAPVDASNNVFEFAAEVNVPLLKGLPLVQDLAVDIAGRYTNYSTSGEAETWKIGPNWQVNELLRFRGTMSVDIRAPNLNDLYQPVGISSTGFTDLLTGGNNSTQLQNIGNAALKPEVAHSVTVGMVLTPDFIPGFTMSVDYFQTHMTNAISLVSYQTNAVQQICLASAPAYDSPYCALAVRPIAVGQPGYTSVANYPTQVKASPLNSATQQMEGWDIEIDYNFELADVWSELPGSISFRHLLSYQPVNVTVSLPGAAPSWPADGFPKTRQTTFLNYQVGDWGLSLQNQWLSGVKKASSQPNATSQNYAVPRVGSYDVLDVTIDRKFDLWGGNTDLYFTVNNIGNTRAPLWPTNASNPGLFYPTRPYHDDMGRYFTIGLRGNL
jgi:iron complex outermembrane receptor protein